MSDRAHEWTDNQIARMQKRVEALYAPVYKNVKKRAGSFYDSISEKAEQLHANIKNAESDDERKAAKNAYTMFFAALIRTRAFHFFADEISELLYKKNNEAAAYINDNLPGIYAQNYNSESEAILSEVSEFEPKPATVEDVKEHGGVERQTVDKRKDITWNTANVRKSVLTGAIIGIEAAELLSKAVQKTVSKNEESARRQASDMATGAESKGTIDAMYCARDEGISIQKAWIETGDNRTRETHRIYGNMGAVDLDFEYNVGLKRPKDSDCSILSDVCNCRCGMRHVFGGVRSATRSVRQGDVTGSYKKSSSFEDTKSINVKNMTYSEWMQWRSR